MKKNKRLESKRRLEHIVQALETVELFIASEDEKSFCKHTMLNNAVLFQFSVIGEAIMHVEQEILDKYAYPWYKIRSFRNFIAHEYFNIKLEAVWVIIQHEVPPLKQKILHMLKHEF
jgi:uncharacterized protein with HEPN domain